MLLLCYSKWEWFSVWYLCRCSVCRCIRCCVCVLCIFLCFEFKLWIIPSFFPRVCCPSVTRFLDSFVDNQLYFGFKEFFNTTRADCVWRDVPIHRRLCPKEVTMELFSNGQREMVSFWIVIDGFRSDFEFIQINLFVMNIMRSIMRNDTRYSFFLREEKLMWRSTRRTKHQQKKKKRQLLLASVQSNSADRVSCWREKFEIIRWLRTPGVFHHSFYPSPISRKVDRNIHVWLLLTGRHNGPKLAEQIDGVGPVKGECVFHSWLCRRR